VSGCLLNEPFERSTPACASRRASRGCPAPRRAVRSTALTYRRL